KSTWSGRTESSSSIAAAPGSPYSRIEDVAKAVAEQVEAHDGEEDGEPGRRRVPPRVGQELARLRDGPAPLGRGRGRPESEEAERRRRQDGEPHADRGPHDDRRRDVGQDVQGDEAEGRCAERGRGLDEHLLLERAGL